MSTSLIESVKYHSAIPSWSGYNYQGKVAIYAVLAFINKRHGIDLSRYSLELEGYEDFAIKEEGSYLSIHQVKSYKYRELSKYKDAIWNLLGKALEKDIKQVYLHTSEQIPSLDNIKEELITLESPKEKKPFYYYELVTSNRNYSRAFENFYKYNYYIGNEKVDFCEITKIDNKIKNQIEEYYNLQGRHESDEQVKRVFLNILSCLDEHISTRHRLEQIQGKETVPLLINLMDFCKIIEKDWEKPSNSYYIKQLKHSFYKESESFLQTLFKGEKVDIKDLERTEEFVAQINLLEDGSFFDFCKKITPYVSVMQMDMQKFRDLIPANGLKMSLIVTLISIKQKLGNKYLLHRKINNKTENYLPTTIDRDPTHPLTSEEVVVGELARDILKNENADELLYDVDVLIAEKVKSDSLEKSAFKINEMPEVDTTVDPDEYKKFMKIKNIRIVDISQAEEELN